LESANPQQGINSEYSDKNRFSRRRFDPETLALRNETQARDVFDLKLLFDASVRAELPAVTRKLIPEALVKAIGICFDDLSGQVVAYLEPEYQQYYRDKRAWEPPWIAMGHRFVRLENSTIHCAAKHGAEKQVSDVRAKITAPVHGGS
jgi:hypothetical protein